MSPSTHFIPPPWECRLTAIKKNIDRYISSHYRPLNLELEHDLDLEEEYGEDDFAAVPPADAVPSVDAVPKQSACLKSRCLRAGDDTADDTEDAAPVSARAGIDDFLRQRGETFSQMLLRLIDERNLKDSQVYRDANIDRRLFSKIRGDEEYIPNKKTVICFCMALQLELPEARRLLEAAGYALSASSRFDLIIQYLLENKEYNVVFANIVLEQYGEGTLTR